MISEACARADEATTCQRDLRALAESIADLDPSALLEAASLGRRDRAFTHLLLALLHLGRPIEASVLVRGAALLPDADVLAAVAGKLEGDVGVALIASVRSRGLGMDREPAALLVAELWSRRKGVARPAGLLAEARIRARREATHEGEDALVALHGLLDDEDLATLVAPFTQDDIKEAARALAGRLVDRMVGAVLSGLPERARREARAKGPVRRAVAKVGRNDSCPCGSGKKYKQCHEKLDQERLADSSDVAGLTFAELTADLERHLTSERLAALRGHELARLDPVRVPEPLRSELVDHLGLWGEHDAALRAIEVWIPAPGALDDALDDALRLVAEHAARGGRPDVTAALVAIRGGRTDGLLLEARLALVADPGEQLRLIEEMALTELDARGVDLGFALLVSGLPGLGVHVARAELSLRKRDPHTDALQATMLEVRDQLGAPPWDPIDDVLYVLDSGVAPEVDRQLAESRRKVEHGDAALKATQEALERMKVELAEVEAARRVVAPAPVSVADPKPAPVVDDAALRAMRERMEGLKAELKDRHRERNALRKELEDARTQVAELQADDEEEEGEALDPEDDGDDLPSFEASVATKVRVPVFPDGFADKLKLVPEATARAAMLRVGELCAGFDVAFREVRPLRGFDQTWRVKVGRSYRLLFRPADTELHVIELLHRQDLEKRLFRLRRGGEL